MLIPSIDLQGGAVVQLVQGERLAIRDDDVFRWVRRFASFPKVQVIDLDAAMGMGDNLRARPGQIAGQLSCRVGGGIRTVERAREVLGAGAQQIIVGSALFKDGEPNLEFAQELADAVGIDARDRGRRQPWRAGRHPRMEDATAADAGRSRARARALLR